MNSFMVVLMQIVTLSPLSPLSPFGPWKIKKRNENKYTLFKKKKGLRGNNRHIPYSSFTLLDRF